MLIIILLLQVDKACFINFISNDYLCKIFYFIYFFLFLFKRLDVDGQNGETWYWPVPL